MSALVAAACLVPVQDRLTDSDGDGLYDRWETQGFGPIDPKSQGCRPDHADIYIVFRIRSNMKAETIQPTIDRMRKFYANLPHKNPDGTNGLNLIAIIPPPMPADTDKYDYNQLYEKAMPQEWRGLAHGVLVGNSPGGGGQTNRPDWCGTGYNWPTLLHEMGHQLGLPHEPMGARTGSPYHRSFMNYDYSYQLNGNIENITLSDGKFIKLKMKETALNEVVPFAAGDLDFLTNRPYFFKIKELDSKHTAVDWNRNGIFGEKRVRANINDGYSVGLGPSERIGRSAGAPCLVVWGKRLRCLLPVLSKEEDYKGFKGDSLTPDTPGKLDLQSFTNRKADAPVTLIQEGVCGDVSAAVIAGTLWVAYPTTQGFAVRSFETPTKPLETLTFDEKVIPSLVVTPKGLQILTWNAETQEISLRNLSGKAEKLPLTSQYPPAAVWNSKRKVLAVATAVHSGKYDGCVQVQELKWNTSGVEIASTYDVGGKAGARTSARPVLLFDPSKDRGPEGGYDIYIKRQLEHANDPSVNYNCHQIQDPKMGDGWRIKMMGNEWALSRSVCSAVPFEGDVAYAYRWSGGSNDHTILVTPRASGIEDAWITDFDEIGYIFSTGLRQSLQAVRDEQWRKH